MPNRDRASGRTWKNVASFWMHKGLKLQNKGDERTKTIRGGKLNGPVCCSRSVSHDLNKLTSCRVSFPLCFAASFGCCQVPAGLPLPKHPAPRRFQPCAVGGSALLPGRASAPVNLPSRRFTGENGERIPLQIRVKRLSSGRSHHITPGLMPDKSDTQCWILAHMTSKFAGFFSPPPPPQRVNEPLTKCNVHVCNEAHIGFTPRFTRIQI